MTAPSAGKRLYITHLAYKLQAMELGVEPMDAPAYRLFAKRLKLALASYPPSLIGPQLRRNHPAIAEALEQRHFETHRMLPGEEGEEVAIATMALLLRLSTSAA